MTAARAARRLTRGLSARPSFSAVPVALLGVLLALACLCSLVQCAPAAQASEGVFALESFSNTLTAESGAPAALAGSHPYSMTTTFVFGHRVLAEGSIEAEPVETEPTPTEVEMPAHGAGGVGANGQFSPRELEVGLPHGLIVDPQATPSLCTESELDSASCPAGSAVGVLTAYTAGYPTRAIAAIYNLVAPTGVPAELGSNLAGLGYVFHIDGRVRSDGDYGLSAQVKQILRSYPIYAISTTLWGDPTAPSHNAERGTCGSSSLAFKTDERAQWEAENVAKGHATREYQFECPAERAETAFLTMPSSCSGQPLLSTLSVTAWNGQSARAATSTPSPAGCASLAFEPSLSLQPESTATSTPTGLGVDLRMPQSEILGGLSSANLDNAVVTLPPGITLNPATAGGREACSSSQIGLLPAPDERQTITLQRPAADTFSFTYEEGGERHTTAPIPSAASAATVQAAIEGLPAVGAQNATVTEVSGGWEVDFTGALAGHPVPLLSGVVSENAVQQIAVDATGGTFTVEYKGEKTAALPYYATAAAVQKALETLPGIGEGNVAVSGGARSDLYTGARSPLTVAFTGALAGMEVEKLTAVSALTGRSATVTLTAQPPENVPLGVAVSEQGAAPRFTATAPECPPASTLGTAEVKTPLLNHPLPGTVYLAAQEDNPFHSLLAMYLVVNDPVTGVIVKLPGHVEVGGGEEDAANGPALASGQIRTSFSENPELPVEEVKLAFTGGPRAPLVTPSACGVYQTVAQLTPWSSDRHLEAEPFTSESAQFVESLSKFQIDENCASPGFAPSFSAGTSSAQAAAFSPFTLSFSRGDGEQDFSGLEQTLPPGMLAKLAGVPQCANAEAAAGACPEASKIGTVAVAAGVGPDPVWVNGTVYLTGPYNNGPFGEVVEVPAIAGPFNLDENGKPVTIRGSIRVNPTTAQATVVSDPFPTMLRGIQLHVRQVNVDLNRPDFTFNPTNCEPLSVTGVLTSTTGTAANVSSPFEAANCATLPFKPGFKVSTSGKTSKANGASLKVDLTYPQSGEANIHSVHVELPKSLPARLTTLQKACTEQEFATNPATCPAASIVGHAKAITPILPVPLEGPAYFVSHGGAAFPELIMVLQGYGVTIQLNGETFINSKTDVTSSTFAHVPDAPVTSFELTLPEESNSALAANGNLCDQKLIMPTLIGGQNGAQIKQNTQIAVTGCPRAISISSHKVSGKTTTLSVYVPAAGELTASGKGLVSASKSSKGQEDVTIAVSQKKAGKLKTKIKLTFTPSKGRKQTKSIAISFKK